MPLKTFKAEPNSEAGITISSNTVRMNSNPSNYVMADERGITINGPVSFVAGSGQMRFGGLWTMNSELMMSLPSTIATPTPVMIINPPIEQFTSIMKDAIVMMGIIGAFGAI